MAAQLQIDQVGLPTGTPGVSRTDGLATGAVVTLTNTGAGATTLFQLLWVPPGDTTAVSTLAATEEDPKVWTFEPSAEVYGTYLVELVQNAGLLTEVRERRVLVVRTPYLGLVIPALNERGDPRASLLLASGTTADNNAVDFSDSALNDVPYAAWWRSMHELAISLDARAAPVRVTHYSATNVTTTGYSSLGSALAANYPSSIPSVAVYDIAPNSHSPTPGPITLDTIVTYVLRSVAGRGSVALPEMALQSSVHIEGCTVGLPLTGDGLLLREAHVNATLAHDALDALDSTFNESVSITTGSYANFDRCAFGPDVTITNTAESDALVMFVGCTFETSPEVVFSGAAPGVVRMDARSNYLWDAAGGSVTNGSIVVEALL